MMDDIDKIVRMDKAKLARDPVNQVLTSYNIKKGHINEKAWPGVRKMIIHSGKMFLDNSVMFIQLKRAEKLMEELLNLEARLIGKTLTFEQALEVLSGLNREYIKVGEVQLTQLSEELLDADKT